MTEFGDWLGANWFAFAQTSGIVFGLVFSGLAIRSATNATRVSNLLQFTGFHREIWSHTIEHPELNRALDPQADPEDISDGERTLINFLILNSAAAFRATQLGAVVSVSEFARDVGLIMNLPIPSVVWDELKIFHEADFVDFIDTAIIEYAPRPIQQTKAGSESPEVEEAIPRVAPIASRSS